MVLAVVPSRYLHFAALGCPLGNITIQMSRLLSSTPSGVRQRSMKMTNHTKLDDALRDLNLERELLVNKIEYIDALIELLPTLEPKYLEAVCQYR
jgi:hypothetical protein